MTGKSPYYTYMEPQQPNSSNNAPVNPQPPGMSPPPVSTSAPQAPKSKKGLIISVLAGGVLFIVVGLLLWQHFGNSPQTAPAPQAPAEEKYLTENITDGSSVTFITPPGPSITYGGTALRDACSLLDIQEVVAASGLPTSSYAFFLHDYIDTTVSGSEARALVADRPQCFIPLYPPVIEGITGVWLRVEQSPLAEVSRRVDLTSPETYQGGDVYYASGQNSLNKNEAWAMMPDGVQLKVTTDRPMDYAKKVLAMAVDRYKAGPAGAPIVPVYADSRFGQVPTACQVFTRDAFRAVFGQDTLMAKESVDIGLSSTLSGQPVVKVGSVCVREQVRYVQGGDSGPLVKVDAMLRVFISPEEAGIALNGYGEGEQVAKLTIAGADRAELFTAKGTPTIWAQKGRYVVYLTAREQNQVLDLKTLEARGVPILQSILQRL